MKEEGKKVRRGKGRRRLGNWELKIPGKEERKQERKQERKRRRCERERGR
jgi:hypothetical protein